jgi:hypothetical protein
MKRYLVALALVGVLLAAGCGDDKKASNVSADSSAKASAKDGSSTTIDTSFSGKGSGDFCSLAEKFTQEFKDQKDASTPEQVKAQFEDISAAITKMAAEAPSEIKADAKFLKEALDEANALYKKHDYDFTKIGEDPEAKNLKVGSPEMGAASNRLSSYLEKVCKIDADEDGDTDGIIEPDSSSSSTETTTTSTP